MEVGGCGQVGEGSVIMVERVMGIGGSYVKL